jgi:Ca2+-transporting ATPase
MEWSRPPEISSNAARGWHALSLDEVRRAMETPVGGLSSAEAERRLMIAGPNALPQPLPPRLWQIVLRQFMDPLIYVLLAAAAVSLLAGAIKDAGFIIAVLAINAAIGTWQENKAEKSSHALRKLLQVRATVVRDGRAQQIAAEHVVPGDLVLIASGDHVPADLRLIEVQGAEIDESLLTGESVAVPKVADWIGPEATPVGDQLNMAFAASTVMRGRASGIAVATGLETQVGRLAGALVATESGKPPLVRRMEVFSKSIAVATLIVAGVIGAIGLGTGRFANWIEMFLFVVALAVSAIPEGLPVAMTVALAVATNRMARRNMIGRAWQRHLDCHRQDGNAHSE